MGKGCVRGCTGFAVTSLAVLAVAYVGFRYGDHVFPTLERWVARDSAAVGEVAPSPSIAEATLDRFDAFRAGETGEEQLRLEGVELSSVVRYAFPGILPVGVAEPTVELRGDDLLLSARVAVSSFPDVPSLGDVLGFLPDTVDIEMRGALIPFDRRYTALHVERVEAGRIPLPGRMIPGILAALGRDDRDGLPADAMAIALPTGIRSAYVEADHLVLVSEEG